MFSGSTHTHTYIYYVFINEKERIKFSKDSQVNEQKRSLLPCDPAIPTSLQYTYLNNGVPQTTHLYIPGSLWCVYSPSKALIKKKINRSSKNINKASVLREHIGVKYISLVNLSRVLGSKMRTDQTYGKLNRTNILQIYIYIMRI